MTDPDHLKIACPSCREHIEFPVTMLGWVIDCPHCGLSTALNVPGFEKKAVPTTITQAPPAARHGVFYYVFWGVVSLGVTLIILSFLTMFGTVALGSFLSGRHNAKAHQAESSGTNSTNSELAALQQAKQNYINTKLVLYEFEAKEQDTYEDKRVPGVSFKIKNFGNRTLERIEVTVSFFDRQGKVIHEAKYHPVSENSFDPDSKPLKPGFIWQLERDHFYTEKSTPTEWSGKAVAKITDISFMDAADF